MGNNEIKSNQDTPNDNQISHMSTYISLGAPGVGDTLIGAGVETGVEEEDEEDVEEVSPSIAEAS